DSRGSAHIRGCHRDVSAPPANHADCRHDTHWSLDGEGLVRLVRLLLRWSTLSWLAAGVLDRVSYGDEVRREREAGAGKGPHWVLTGGEPGQQLALGAVQSERPHAASRGGRCQLPGLDFR